MKLVAIIAFELLTSHCALCKWIDAQNLPECTKSFNTSTEECMKMLHPKYQLLQQTPYLFKKYLDQILDHYKNVQLEINNEKSHNIENMEVSDCLHSLLDHLTNITNSYFVVMTDIDNKLKEDHKAVYFGMEGIFTRIERCVKEPHESCEAIEKCCSNVKEDLYGHKNVSVEGITNFLNDYEIGFIQKVNSIVNSIAEIQASIRGTCLVNG